MGYVCQVFLIVRFWRDRGWIGDDDDRWEPRAFVFSREGIHGMPAPFPGKLFFDGPILCDGDADYAAPKTGTGAS